MKTRRPIRHIILTLLVILPSLHLAGCGGGSDASAEADGAAARSAAVTDFRIITDTYGLQRPNYLLATDNSLGLVLRAERVDAAEDIWFDSNILRVECPSGVTPGSYDLGTEESVCRLTVFNGFPSTRLETIGGSLEISETEGCFSGRFEVLYADRNLPEAPLNWLSATFSAPVGYGEPISESAPSVPPEALSLFDNHCSGCHQLPELSRTGGYLADLLESDSTHREIVLTVEEVHALKVLLNAVGSPDDVVPPR